MKALVVTVAGMATRFSESVARECLKCAYYEELPEEAILYRLIYRRADYFDIFIIVGGFHYDELGAFVAEYMQEHRQKIVLVRNGHFREYGSGYSLYLGMEEALKRGCDELIFAEGDLYFDTESFIKICDSPKDVLSSNRDVIQAAKSVAYYFSTDGLIHYIFDMQHGALEIPEPFTEIGNSGQVWKFTDMKRLRDILETLSEKEMQGTNLIIIQKYFGVLGREAYEIVEFRQWMNCNTVGDFRKSRVLEERQ